MKEKQIWKDYLPVEMKEHWTVYECLKESEDSATFIVKETAAGILCVLKWGRNMQAELLRNEMEILEKLADRKLSGIPKAYRIFEENGEVYLVREYIEGTPLAQMVLQKGGIPETEICRISRKICRTAEQFQNPDNLMIHRDIKPENIVITVGGGCICLQGLCALGGRGRWHPGFLLRRSGGGGGRLCFLRIFWIFRRLGLCGSR